MKHYDTIIIGGGLSGCVLGYLLKKKNRNVLIIEKQKLETKNKLFGGLLTQKTYDLLVNIYGKFAIESLDFNKYDNFTIKEGNISFTVNHINTYSIYRKKLDDFVLNQYILSGGDLIQGKYTNLDMSKNTLLVNNQEYTYSYLVGADGVLSQLRHTLTNSFQEKNFALELPLQGKEKNSVEISFLDRFKGYAWMIPNKDCSMIGIGNVAQELKINEYFNDYLSSNSILKDNETVKGAFLPTGNDIKLIVKDVYFIGDSAGLISPITGEGIYYAVYSAYILSMDFKHYLKNMKSVIKKIRRDLFYLRFVQNEKIRRYLFSRYNTNKMARSLVNKFARHIL